MTTQAKLSAKNKVVKSASNWKAHPPELYGIARYEKKGMPNWRARFSRRGKEYSQRFYDHLEGGMDAALQKAKAWRDRMLGQVDAMTRAEFVEMRLKNNTSGNAGVTFVTRYKVMNNGSRTEYVCWEARAPHGLKPYRSRSFGIKKYGYDEAYIRAVAARWDFVAEMEGDHLPRVPAIHRKPRKK